MGMEMSLVAKNAGAFRTISEVAEDLDLPQHVLRFWETRFPQIRPLKRAGGRRFYRPSDVDLLRDIRDLLYRDGYTIKGVQRLLRERGARGLREGPAAGQPPGPEADEPAPVAGDDVDPIAAAIPEGLVSDQAVADGPAEQATGVGFDARSLIEADGSRRVPGHATPGASPDEPAASLRRALTVIEECERRLRAALLPGD